jgi:energy-coupling factor transport system substrate-specific component
VSGGKGRLLIVSAAGVLAVALLALTVSKRDWGFLSVAFVCGALAFWYWCFERSTASSREVGVVAVLGAIAAVARVPFAALPGIQPATFLIIAAGFVFRPLAGFMVGATAAFVSNFFLGQGPWTPWQMLAWGLAGATAGWLKTAFPRHGRLTAALFCFAWGYLYGWIMDFWFWTAFINPLTWKSFLATYAASFWFDTFHALSNAGFYLLLGSRVIKVLERFQKKIHPIYPW